MNNQPLVSICIPTYNGQEFLVDCLQSAVEQTYKNTEILISDDGSKDGTLEIVARFRRQHPHLRLVKNEGGGGMVNNWNNCILSARGEWIKFLFQDDVLQPACVEKMIAACTAHNVQVGLCRRTFIVQDDIPKPVRNFFRYRVILPERVFENLTYIAPERLAREVAEVLPENILGEPTCYLFHKDIFGQIGFFHSDYRQLVDMDLLLRAALLKGIAFVSEPLAEFRVHGKSETTANHKKEKEAQLRTIAANTGDTILLYYNFLTDPAFRLVKEAVGEDVLQLLINHLYHSGCKHKGEKIFNKALAPIRRKYKGLGDMRYSFFKYARYRKLFRQWEKENRL